MTAAAASRSIGTDAERHVAMLDAMGAALGDLFGAERRLRGREQQQAGDLTHAQFRAIRMLEKTDEATAGELARSADLNPASVTAMLDQLEASGIVQRRRSTEDRRVCMVSVTPQGRALLEHKRAAWQAAWKAKFSDMSTEQLATVVRVMHKIAELIDEL
jgi:MarR family transcriptional regulator, organic hydroperoxide resistance regulator